MLKRKQALVQRRAGADRQIQTDQVPPVTMKDLCPLAPADPRAGPEPACGSSAAVGSVLGTLFQWLHRALLLLALSSFSYSQKPTGPLVGDLLLGPPADPITKAPGEHGGPESHTPPDFSDTDRRTSVPSGLGFCFLFLFPPQRKFHCGFYF